MESDKNEFNRIIYFDYLKVFASFAVIFLHVSSQNWYSLEVNTLYWQILNVYDSAVRWCVPIFVMVSGAIFLNRKNQIKIIFFKNIYRLLLAFIFWGFVYSFVGGEGLKQTLLSVISGHYHFWFIPMIIGVYICIPIIYKIIESKEVVRYFIVVSFFSNFLIPQIMMIVNDFGTDIMKKVLVAVNSFYSNIDLNVVLGFIFYFVIGFYVHQINLNRNRQYAIYLLGVLGFLTTIFLNALLSIQRETPIETYYDNFTINVLLESLAIFVFFKYNIKNYVLLNLIIKNLSRYSFGVYLVHVLVIEQLNELLGVNTLSFNPVLSVPVISIIVFVISYIISAIIHQVPVLKRYIV